ncbi:hypothetical protein [Reyranella sp.]|uniref:hypothetical protein n=1 Tax=Reyranella sp. TaxID=1929291 RepID=UPI003D0A0D82
MPHRVWWGMKPLVLVGIALIALGVVGLAVDNISFTEQKTVIDAGPLKVTAAEQRTIPIPTIAGVAAVIVGLGLCFMGARKSA